MTTIKILCFFSILILLNATSFSELLKSGFEQKDHPFGGNHFIKKSEDLVESMVYFSQHQNIFDYYNNLKNNKYEEIDIKSQVEQCEADMFPSYFKFSAGYIGNLGDQEGHLDMKPSLSFEARCFQNVQMSYQKIDQSTIEITVQNSNPKSLMCEDMYLFGSTFNYHLETNFFHGTHKIRWNNLNAQDMENIEQFGIHIFKFCDHLRNILPDILMTALLFVGGKMGKNPPSILQQEMNVNFLKVDSGYQYLPRNNQYVNLDESDIHSGDYVMITRFDGIDQIIAYGAGAGPGHSAVAIWFDDGLYVCESQDNVYYWPKGNIQRTSYKDWVKYAQTAGYNVAIVPLREEIRAKFNVTAAIEHFRKVEGTPFGIHNMVFCWIDTPDCNFPPLLSADLAAVIFSIIEKIDPKLVMSFMGEGLNKRLNTTNLTVSQIATVIGQKNMTFGDLMAIPENDDWEYSDGKSYVCCCFVVSMYKAGGLFDGMEVQATEFTPRDLVMLNFWDLNSTRPQVCQDADPELPYCQIMGRYQMVFPDMNTITPYDKMNERCPSQPPQYFRPEGC